MPEQLSSRNFEFLQDYDPLLVEYALKAETTAYSDPNTSLLKTRQFGEWLAEIDGGPRWNGLHRQYF